MKHIFIINGKKEEAYNKLKEELSKLEGIDYEIHKTTASKEATAYINEYCKNNEGEKVRFYACGGDGTVNEVASAVAFKENASMSVYPCGTGNDFVKTFGGADKFLDLNKLVNAKEEKIDIMKIGEHYSINVCNFGFDATVALTANKVAEKGGKKPYVKGVAKAIFTARYNKIFVEADGEKMNKKSMLLCTLANGQYVGGQFHCAPKSKCNDGLIDVCLIDKMCLFRFLKILKPYTNGEHLNNKKYEKFVHYKQCKKVKISSKKDFYICLDGEMVYGNNFEVEICPSAVNFAIPEGAND